jgi:hypothetical protein
VPVIRFTDLSISKLKAERQTRYMDTSLPGFGILVGKTRRTFFVFTDSKKRTLRTLGRYPAMRLQDARRRAVAIIDGTERIQAAQSPSDRIAEYIAQLQATSRWKYEQHRLLCRYLLPNATDLATITKKDILRITDGIKHARSEQLHCHRALKAFFSWRAARDYITTYPMQGLPAPSTQNSRDRVLAPDELKRVWMASKQLGQLSQSGRSHGRRLSQ